MWIFTIFVKKKDTSIFYVMLQNVLGEKNEFKMMKIMFYALKRD